MKKLWILFVAFALLAVAVKADVQPFGGSGWAPCNSTGDYGGHATDNCFVAWNGITQACDETNRDATFTVGTNGMTTTMITIDHLNGISDTDGFEVKDGDNVLCTVADVPTDTEDWVLSDCAVNFQDVKTLTLHPTAAAWADCATWGQVAVKDITFDAAPTDVKFHGNTNGCYVDPENTLITGWGIPAISGGVYGGESYDNFCLVWEPTCADDTNTASVVMAFAGGNEVITIKHLDGMSNLDSFDVLVDDSVVGHYSDSLNPSEDWVITNFPVNVVAGIHTVTLKVTDAAWNGCNDWGQIAVDSMAVGPGNDVPEFGVIAALVAIIGALGIVIYRRK